MLVIILVFGEDLRGPSYVFGLNDVIEIFGIAGMFLVLGAPIAYTVTVVIGLPIYLIASRFGVINFWSVLLGAVFVAILPILVISAPQGFVLYKDPEKSSLLFYSALTLCGLVVGLVFWFVSGLNRLAHNNQLNQDAPKNGAPVS